MIIFFYYFKEINIKYWILSMSENTGSMMHTPSGDIEQKFIDAKAYLQTTSSKSGDNL